jgi:hypothetical protein
MKKIIIALLLCIAMVGIITAPALATPGSGNGAVKVDLVKVVYYDGTIKPVTITLGQAVGSIIFNTTSSGKINILIKVDSAPNLKDYDVRVIFPEYDPLPPINPPNPPNPPIFSDVLNTNAKGHGNVQLKRDIPELATGDTIKVTVNIAEILPSPTGPAYTVVGPVTVPLK